MKPEDIKLLELLQGDEDAGTIYFKNRRMLVFDADALGLLRKELINTLGFEQALPMLARFGYARGYRDALTMKEMFDWQNLEDWWRAGRRLATVSGIVSSRILQFHIDEEAKSFEVEAEWLNSYEAEQHLKHIGKSETPVCWSLIGYAGGYASAVFSTDCFYFETECVGKGDARCRVTGRSVDRLGDSIKDAEQYYNIKDFDQRIPEILEQRAGVQNLVIELEKRSLELERDQERIRTLELQIVALQESISQNFDLEELIGTSINFTQAISDVERVAATDATVLITGETGTGKELIARAIHTRSSRRGRPLVTVNCAALPAGLVESELFGHEKGAFTGAVQRKLGRFELANGATIFLDEVGELPLETQAKFLRVLQQGEFERVGGTPTLKVDVRVIAATNQPLSKLVEEGKYRADLYFRLNVFPITIPPLRERGSDIVLLTNYFAQKFRARFKKRISSINQASLEALKHYSWPGNVRELEHIVERAVLLADSEILTINLPVGANVAQTTINTGGTTKLITLEEKERNYIQEVLRHTGGMIAGKGGAADILDLPASTLRSRMKKLGIK
jgi:transcriptional regulator with PAS, ATPase and Fis domain